MHEIQRPWSNVLYIGKYGKSRRNGKRLMYCVKRVYKYFVFLRVLVFAVLSGRLLFPVIERHVAQIFLFFFYSIYTILVFTLRKVSINAVLTGHDNEISFRFLYIVGDIFLLSLAAQMVMRASIAFGIRISLAFLYDY